MEHMLARKIEQDVQTKNQKRVQTSIFSPFVYGYILYEDSYLFHP